MPKAIHLNLDNAWPADALPIATRDVTRWGPHLRFSAPARLIESFYAKTATDPFVLYGSGDFHHLTALWLRKLTEPFVLVSFDNHPDWDIRPPRWCCGGWLNRALELPHLTKISVWGCGNFECWWPGRIFGNRRAERNGKLEVHPWADDRLASDQERHGAILSTNWRKRFTEFARALGRTNLYVTIDLDCLRTQDAVTNWENGRFAIEDVAWAVSQLREAGAQIIGGDICGAHSHPVYARFKQRLAATIDHPKLGQTDSDQATKINLRAFEVLWPILLAE